MITLNEICRLRDMAAAAQPATRGAIAGLVWDARQALQQAAQWQLTGQPELARAQVAIAFESIQQACAIRDIRF